MTNVIEQKNQEKSCIESELERAKEVVKTAQELVKNLEKEITTLREQVAQFIKERNQLEEQCRKATNLVETAR